MSLEKKYRDNPFIVKLKDKMYIQPRANTVIARGEKLIDTETGEVLKDDVLLGRRKFVDKSQFAKIYCSEVGILYELSKTATNVFFYLTREMDYQNQAYLNYHQDYNAVGYKGRLSVLKGLLELVEKDIIAPSYKTHHYWLNPLVVCKGERFAKYYEYVVDRQKEPNTIVKEQFKEDLERLPKQVRGKMSRASRTLEKAVKAKKK